MPRIAALHLGFDDCVAAAPEARKIACDLHRAMRRRQKLDDERHASAGNGRMSIEAEQFLHADRKLGSLRRIIVDSNRGAGRRNEMGGSVGIEPEVKSRVFEPYFSTRAAGTGLGLAIARKVIEDHGGTISLESSPGQGTAVTILLPLGN